MRTLIIHKEGMWEYDTITLLLVKTFWAQFRTLEAQSPFPQGACNPRYSTD